MTDDDLRAAYDGVDQNTADWHIRGLRAVAALVKAEQPQPEAQPVACDEYCWLVELFEGDGSGNSAGFYHTGFVDIGGRSRTTRDPFKARRYGTRDQADAVATELGTTLTGTWRAVEHGFAAAPPPSAPQPEAQPVAWTTQGDIDGVRAGYVMGADLSPRPTRDCVVPLYDAPPTPAEQPQPEVQPTVGVQACRPEDRAMLATPAGAELVAKVAQALAVPKAVATAPERIWLQIGDSRAHMDEPFPGDGATWCADSVVDAEVEYVRADLAPPPSAPCPHIRSSGVGDHATHWCALNGPPAAEPSAAERRLRRLLCLVKHGRSAYMDDGEASDCSAHPSIDYLRDSLDEIEAKWRQRAAAAARNTNPA